MKLDMYLKRQRITLEHLINLLNISEYSELVDHCQSIGIKCSSEEEVKYVFESQAGSDSMEKGSASKRSTKNNGDNKPAARKRSNSTSAGRSKTRTSKSQSTRRGGRRKKASDNVESVLSNSKSGSNK
tara:strand:+ start:6061 stop:6444 length:384 start_codon:yes stop_codon:yes gene_type:complete